MSTESSSSSSDELSNVVSGITNSLTEKEKAPFPPPAHAVQAAGLADFLGNVLPHLASFKDWLILFINNQDAFVIIMDGVSKFSAADTFVAKEEALHIVGKQVAILLDKYSQDRTVSILATLPEDKLIEELVSRSLQSKSIRSLGIQGSSGVQVSAGEVRRIGKLFFEQILPILLPLLLKRLQG